MRQIIGEKNLVPLPSFNMFAGIHLAKGKREVSEGPMTPDATCESAVASKTPNTKKR